ncbi:MAG: MFS transporter [bacterium]|nr:MFS transporter [bacterium]
MPAASAGLDTHLPDSIPLMLRSGRFPSASADEQLIPPAAAVALFGVVIVVTHGMGNSLVPALLPRISESFQAGYGVLGLTVAAGLLSYGAGAVVGIRVVDRVPSRGLLVLCLLVCGAGLLAVSVSGSPATMAVCAVVIGLSSPISWSVSVYLISRVVRSGAHGRVLAVAAAGAGVGNGVNGVFVQLLTAPDQWRWAFVIAGGLAVGAAVATRLVLRRPIEPPSRVDAGRQRRIWRRIWSVPAGRLVLGLSMVAGIGTFTFGGYISEIALDELSVSSPAAAVPWWLASGVGVSAAFLAGLKSDRGSPVGVMSITSLTYAAALTVLALTWSYPALLIATFGFAVFNFPIWGLFGLVAHRGLPPELAVRSVSGGLALGACSAMCGVTAAGWWIDRTGSFRGPAILLAVMIATVAIWLGSKYRTESTPHSQDPARGGDKPAYIIDGGTG